MFSSWLHFVLCVTSSLERLIDVWLFLLDVALTATRHSNENSGWFVGVGRPAAKGLLMIPEDRYIFLQRSRL